MPSYSGLTYPTRKYYPTWETKADEPAVRVAEEAFQTAFGEDPEVGFWTFSTNGVATAGMHDLTTIGFGPGHERFAHAPNEQTEVDHLVRATAFYAALVDGYASQPNSGRAAS